VSDEEGSAGIDDLPGSVYPSALSRNRESRDRLRYRDSLEVEEAQAARVQERILADRRVTVGTDQDGNIEVHVSNMSIEERTRFLDELEMWAAAGSPTIIALLPSASAALLPMESVD
jgi:hypothetical protein